MKKSYVKPVLNSSMEGTLEGVYAYGQAGCIWRNPCYDPCKPSQPEKKSSNNASEAPAQEPSRRSGGLFIEFWFWFGGLFH